ncbi:MAG: hypothetical protein ACE5JM_10170, partial [Armatimonadota bacterium]
LTAHKYQRKGAGPFSEADFHSTAVVAGHAAIAISNVHLRRKLEREPSAATFSDGQSGRHVLPADASRQAT